MTKSDEDAQVRAEASVAGADSLSHNLLGQRLGRKGRDTRERILAATEHLLAAGPETTISLSAVAREASLGMTTLYLYFSDLTELLLAVLDPVIASAEESYIAPLRAYWPDDALAAHCLTFVQSFHEYWQRHSRILHLRNSLADNNDERMRANRIAATQPLRALFVSQMDGEVSETTSAAFATATVLITGVERTITMATDANIASMSSDSEAHAKKLVLATARLLELGIRDGREIARAEA